MAEPTRVPDVPVHVNSILSESGHSPAHNLSDTGATIASFLAEIENDSNDSNGQQDTALSPTGYRPCFITERSPPVEFAIYDGEYRIIEKIRGKLKIYLNSMFRWSFYSMLQHVKHFMLLIYTRIDDI